MSLLRKFFTQIMFLLACVGIATQLHATDDSVQIKLNLQKGDVYKVNTSGTGTAQVEFSPQISTMIFQVLNLPAEDATAQNKWTVQSKSGHAWLVRVIDVDSAGNSTIEYESSDMHVEFIAKLSNGIEYQVYLAQAKDGIIIDVKKGDQVLFHQENKVLPDAEKIDLTLTSAGRVIKVNNLVVADLLSNLTQEESIKLKSLVSFAESVINFLSYPSTPVKKGDHWNYKMELALPLNEIVEEEGVSVDPLNLAILADTQLTDLRDGTAVFKTHIATNPSEWKWGMNSKEFTSQLNLNTIVDSETSVDIATGLPKKMSADQIIKFDCFFTSPEMGFLPAEKPTPAVSINSNTKMEYTLTKEKQ